MSPHSVRLHIASGPHQGQEYVLADDDAVVVGRDSEAQWCLKDDPYFSRFHFRVVYHAGVCLLLDLGSRNGTKVNGELVTSRELNNGDEINCGRTNIAVLILRGASSVETLELPAPGRDNLSTIELPAFAPDPSPRLIGDYEILGELGRGTMGRVYHGRHQKERTEVAIILLNPGAADPDEASELFEREARVLSSLSHPNIVRYLGFGRHQNSSYLVMEKLPVIDFNTALAKQSLAQRVRLVCRVIGKVLAALQHVHERGIVHRDVKPSNLLIFHVDGKIGVKLADFGLAKNYADAGMSSVSTDGQPAAKPLGAPPRCPHQRQAGQASTHALWSVHI